MSSATDACQGQPRATRIVFFILGLAAGAWAPLAPFAKTRLGLDDGAFGLLLLCVGAGSIVAMPLAGALAARLGCRRVLVAAAITHACVFPLVALAPGPITLGAALFVFGAALGSMDCVINIQAIVVERDRGRPMMSGFHALYSLGGVAGAGAVSGLIGVGAAQLTAMIVVSAAILAAARFAWGGLLVRGQAGGGPAFAVPRGAVVLIGLFCFVVFLAEGSALDWSAVYLRTARHAAAAQAGLAFVAFSAFMTAGRLVGDRLVARVGRRGVVAGGAAMAAAGLMIAMLGPGVAAVVAGYAVVGAGCANIVPALFTFVGRQTAMPQGPAVAAVSVLGYAGILAGPAGIGFVANASSLAAALLIVAVLLLLVAAGAGRLPG
jgi:predicted MFS family arabinose efflux permease